MKLYNFIKTLRNKCGKTGLLIGGILPVQEQFDAERDRQVEESYKNRDSLTFEERFDLLWRQDSRGNFSPELEELQYVTGITIVGSFLVAYSMRAKDILEKFKVDNKHEMFQSPRAAQDLVRKDMGLHGTIAGLRAATKYGLMVFIFTFTTQLMNTYLNDIRISGHAACGFVLGGCYKIISGPKAMVRASLIGSACGALHGLSKRSALWLTDTDYQGYLLKEYEKKISDDRQKIEYAKQDLPKRDFWYADKEEKISDPNERNAFMRQLVSLMQWFNSK